MRKKTVVIVQRLAEFGDRFGDWLVEAGYRVRFCPGPTPPDYACWAEVFADCPLWKQADLLIYDPWLARDSATYSSESMLTTERERHPTKPVLIWGSGAAIPAAIADMARPGMFELLPPEVSRESLIAAVRRLIGPPNGADSDGMRGRTAA